MDRRELLALLGGSLAAGSAGCLGDDSDDEDGDATDNGTSDDTDDGSTGESAPGDGSTDKTGDDTGSGTDSGTGGDGTDDGDDGVQEIPGEPLATVDQYVDAIDNENGQTAIDLLHEDSELTTEDVTRDLEFFAGADVTLVERGFAEFGESEITARGILDVQGTEEGPMTIGLELTLEQTPSGRWRITDGRAVQLDTEGDESGEGGDEQGGDDQTDGNESEED